MWANVQVAQQPLRQAHNTMSRLIDYTSHILRNFLWISSSLRPLRFGSLGVLSPRIIKGHIRTATHWWACTDGHFIIINIIIINLLDARAVGPPQTTLQPVFSSFRCSPLPSGICRTPDLSIPWCLPTSSNTVPCGMILVRDAQWEIWPYLISLHHIDGARSVRSNCPAWHRLPHW